LPSITCSGAWFGSGGGIGGAGDASGVGGSPSDSKSPWCPQKLPADFSNQPLLSVVHAERTHVATVINRLKPKLADSQTAPVVEI
jgi:hypothetical protein